MTDRLVIIPTYNERENIQRIIERIWDLEKPFDILVVDDNSPDGTAAVVQQFQQEAPNAVFLLERKEKQGLGTAYIAGFRWALQHDYEYIFEMDADASHNPGDLVRLHQACANQHYDMSIGSRYVKGGSVENWPLNRILLSYFASVYVRVLTWLPIKDTTAGFVCYQREVLEQLDFQKIRFIGYAFQIEMKFAIWKMGFSLKEVPITFVDRKIGESKMNRGIFKEAVWGVVKMAVLGWWKDYRKTPQQDKIPAR